MKKNWLNNILNYTVTPPEGVWNDIANSLNEDDKRAAGISTKLLNYEAAAPDTALTNIFAVLDKEDQGTDTQPAAEKMQQYTQEPPDAVWNNINATLDKKEPASIIPLKDRQNKLKAIYNIAAAAVVFAVILIPVLLNKKKPDAAITPVATIKTGTKPASIIADTNKAPVVSADEALSKNKISSIQIQPEKLKTRVAFPDVIEYIKGNEIADLAADPRKTDKEKLRNADGQTPENIGLITTPNTYISITGPDGQSVKISSKFSTLIDYLNEQNPATIENIDIIIKESAQWRATFTQWRNKMTNNTVAPSLGNFMDIIELSKVLEEKK